MPRIGPVRSFNPKLSFAVCSIVSPSITADRLSIAGNGAVSVKKITDRLTGVCIDDAPGSHVILRNVTQLDVDAGCFTARPHINNGGPRRFGNIGVESAGIGASPESYGPPGGGPRQVLPALYSHDPPGGGRPGVNSGSRNIALLTNRGRHVGLQS